MRIQSRALPAPKQSQASATFGMRPRDRYHPMNITRLPTPLIAAPISLGTTALVLFLLTRGLQWICLPALGFAALGNFVVGNRLNDTPSTQTD